MTLITKQLILLTISHIIPKSHFSFNIYVYNKVDTRLSDPFVQLNLMASCFKRHAKTFYEETKMSHNLFKRKRIACVYLE